MFDPEDPPEPTEDEMRIYDEKGSAKGNEGIEIHGLTVENVQHILQGLLEQEKYRVSETIRTKIQEGIKDAVEKLVSEVAADTVRSQIQAEVQAQLAEGIKFFDSYSGKVKSTKSLQEFILELLHSKESRGSYGDRVEGTFVQLLVKDTVKAQFQAAFGKEIEAAQKEVRAQIDEPVKAKLAETLKSALGLR